MPSFLKYDAKYKNIPIIMLTARSQESDKAIGEETGADEYITKPFEFNDVLEIMQKIYRLKFMDLVTNKTIDKLKYDLVRNNIITFEDIEKAQEMASVQNINLGQVLINTGMITEQELLKFLEEKLHIPSVNLEDYEIDKNVLILSAIMKL